MRERTGRLPIEFTALRCISRGRGLRRILFDQRLYVDTLTTTWKAKLNRARITAMVGPERARELFVEDSPLDHFVVGEAAGERWGAPTSCAAAWEDSDTQTAKLVGGPRLTVAPGDERRR